MRFKLILILSALAITSAHAGLLHSYDFSSAVTDNTGTENGVLVNGASVTGGVLSLDGTGYAEFGTHLIPTSGSYSVVFDFRLAGEQSGIHELISQGSSGGPGFYIGSSNSFDFRVTDSWGSSGVAFPTDTLWHRAALVVDGTANTSTFFLDGNPLGSLASAIATTAGGSNTRLGAQFALSGEFFNGQMDNVLIYDSAITPTGLTGTPEPSALWLMSGGALGLLIRARARGLRHRPSPPAQA